MDGPRLSYDVVVVGGGTAGLAAAIGAARAGARTALVERSTAQRRELAEAVTGVRRASAEPLLLGAGIAATLLASSPKLRAWVVRGWAVYAFVRQLLGR